MLTAWQCWNGSSSQHSQAETRACWTVAQFGLHQFGKPLTPNWPQKLEYCSCRSLDSPRWKNWLLSVNLGTPTSSTWRSSWPIATKADLWEWNSAQCICINDLLCHCIATTNSEVTNVELKVYILFTWSGQAWATHTPKPWARLLTTSVVSCGFLAASDSSRNCKSTVSSCLNRAWWPAMLAFVLVRLVRCEATRFWLFQTLLKCGSGGLAGLLADPGDNASARKRACSDSCTSECCTILPYITKIQTSSSIWKNWKSCLTFGSDSQSI